MNMYYQKFSNGQSVLRRLMAGVGFPIGAGGGGWGSIRSEAATFNIAAHQWAPNRTAGASIPASWRWKASF